MSVVFYYFYVNCMCVFVQPPESKECKEGRLPEVFCVVSSVGANFLYEQLLSEMERIRRVSWQFCCDFVKSAYDCQMPRLGSTVQVRLAVRFAARLLRTCVCKAESKKAKTHYWLVSRPTRCPLLAFLFVPIFLRLVPSIFWLPALYNLRWTSHSVYLPFKTTTLACLSQEVFDRSVRHFLFTFFRSL